MFSILDKRKQINIDGNILICDDLCNLDFFYKRNNKIISENTGKYLSIKYDNGSFISYNGANNNTSSNKYFLKNIIFTAPIKNWIGGERNINGIEMILFHSSEDNNSCQLTSVILFPSSSDEDKEKLSYKFFEKFIDKNTFPIRNKGPKDLENIEWEATDLLPEDKSFYTYNDPDNDSVNWIIMENDIGVPEKFISNFMSFVLGINSSNKNTILGVNDSTPNNPGDLIIFGHKMLLSNETINRIEKKRLLGCNNINNSATNNTDTNANNTTNLQNNDLNKVDDIENEIKDDIKGEFKENGGENGGKDKEDGTTKYSFWTIFFIVLLSVILFSIVLSLILYFINPNYFSHNFIIVGIMWLWNYIKELFGYVKKSVISSENNNLAKSGKNLSNSSRKNNLGQLNNVIKEPEAQSLSNNNIDKLVGTNNEQSVNTNSGTKELQQTLLSNDLSNNSLNDSSQQEPESNISNEINETNLSKLSNELLQIAAELKNKNNNKNIEKKLNTVANELKPKNMSYENKYPKLASLGETKGPFNNYRKPEKSFLTKIMETLSE